MAADIFAAIPSYADPDIVRTVKNLLDAARACVRVAVILQDDDPTVEQSLIALGADVHAMRTEQARGCGWARAMAASLWKDEPWYYQCDAHMSFEPGWDTHLIEQAKRMPTPGVLSAHPLDTGATDPNLTAVTDVFGVTDFGTACGARNMPVWGGQPIPGRAVSGANQFMAAHIIQEVPLDPHLMFWGEEAAMALRFWTHGYDIWHPGGRAVVRHKYMHERRVKEDQYWVRKPEASTQNARAFERIDVLFGRRSGDLGAYGLGAARTRQQWESFAEVEIDNVGGKAMKDEVWRPLQNP